MTTHISSRKNDTRLTPLKKGGHTQREIAGVLERRPSTNRALRRYGGGTADSAAGRGHTWNEASGQIDCSRGFGASWSRRFAEQWIAGLYSRHRGQLARVLTPGLEAKILDATRQAQSVTTRWTTSKWAERLAGSAT